MFPKSARAIGCTPAGAVVATIRKGDRMNRPAPPPHTIPAPHHTRPTAPRHHRHSRPTTPPPPPRHRPHHRQAGRQHHRHRPTTTPAATAPPPHQHTPPHKTSPAGSICAFYPSLPSSVPDTELDTPKGC